MTLRPTNRVLKIIDRTLRFNAARDRAQLGPGVAEKAGREFRLRRLKSAPVTTPPNRARVGMRFRACFNGGNGVPPSMGFPGIIVRLTGAVITAYGHPDGDGISPCFLRSYVLCDAL